MLQEGCQCITDGLRLPGRFSSSCCLCTRCAMLHVLHCISWLFCSLLCRLQEALARQSRPNSAQLGITHVEPYSDAESDLESLDVRLEYALAELTAVSGSRLARRCGELRQRYLCSVCCLVWARQRTAAAGRGSNCWVCHAEVGLITSSLVSVWQSFLQVCSLLALCPSLTFVCCCCAGVLRRWRMTRPATSAWSPPGLATCGASGGRCCRGSRTMRSWASASYTCCMMAMTGTRTRYVHEAACP